MLTQITKERQNVSGKTIPVFCTHPVFPHLALLSRTKCPTSSEGLPWDRVPRSRPDRFCSLSPRPLSPRLTSDIYHPEPRLTRPGLQLRAQDPGALGRCVCPRACSPARCTFRRQEREAFRRAHSSWLAPYFSTVSHTCSSVISKRSSRLSWPGVIS